MSENKTNQEKLQDALGLLDDELLLEVEKLRRAPQKRRPPLWHRLAAIAACLGVLVGSVFAGKFFNQGGMPKSTEYLSADEETEGAIEEGILEEEKTETETEDIEIENFETSEGDESSTAAGAALPEAVGVTIEPLMVDLCDHPDISADMERLFNYQGRC